MSIADAPADTLDTRIDTDKGHGRVEERTVTVSRDVDWLGGDRRFPGELRLPDVATLVRVCARAELADRCRIETRYYVSSASLDAKRADERSQAGTPTSSPKSSITNRVNPDSVGEAARIALERRRHHVDRRVGALQIAL